MFSLLPASSSLLLRGSREHPPLLRNCAAAKGRHPLRVARASLQAMATQAAVDAEEGRVTVGSGKDSLDICRVVNGMWQTSSPSWGRAERGAVVESMLRHFDAGLTTFDMADIYGPAEELYGAFMERMRRERGEAEAARAQGLTKFVPRPGRMSRAVVEAAIDRSRQRMKVDTLDMVQFHWWDYGSPEYLDALRHLTDLRDEGKIRSIALTNFDTDRLRIILENNIPVVSNQVQHSLVDMRPQQRMAELCADSGVKLITYGTVLGGLLSEKFLGAKEPNSLLGQRLTTPSQGKYKQVIDAWGGWALFQKLLAVCKAVADKHGVDISTVGLRYILDQPAVGASMVGVRFGIAEHIIDTQKVFTLKLDEDDRATIGAIIAKGKNLVELIGDCGDEYR